MHAPTKPASEPPSECALEAFLDGLADSEGALAPTLDALAAAGEELEALLDTLAGTDAREALAELAPTLDVNDALAGIPEAAGKLST